jgi:formate dehydrogenase iron-sulfur subunit
MHRLQSLRSGVQGMEPGPEDGLNLLGMSFDNTGMLGANSWRHVAFIEQQLPLGNQDAGMTKLPTGPSGTGQMTEVVSPG